MTQFEDTMRFDGQHRKGGSEGEARATIALIAAALSGMLCGIIAYMAGFGLFWAAVVYFSAGQVFFLLSCLRFARSSKHASAIQRQEIEKDTVSLSESKRNVSLL